MFEPGCFPADSFNRQKFESPVIGAEYRSGRPPHLPIGRHTSRHECQLHPCFVFFQRSDSSFRTDSCPFFVSVCAEHKTSWLSPFFSCACPFVPPAKRVVFSSRAFFVFSPPPSGIVRRDRGRWLFLYHVVVVCRPKTLNFSVDRLCRSQCML